MATAVGRFQVMAVLQAARAHVLGLPLDSARSWGLNRAIFYAAAKRGFKGAAGKAPGPARPKGARAAPAEFWLGDDKAYKVTAKGKMLFTIGGETQTPEDFDRQIARRFTGTFLQAWDEALGIVRAFPLEILRSPAGFYEQVYRPRRDELAKRWTERGGRASPPARSR